MSNLSSIFKNGGPNYSFGRVFSGLVLAVGLTIIMYGAFTDVVPMQMAKYDEVNKNSYVETLLVRKVDGANLQSLMIGIATLAGAIYGMSKIGTVANTFAENKSKE
jgi:hypothetical protein